MHIGLFVPAWPINQFSNGIVTYVHHLREGLLQQGHRVSVFSNVIGSGNTASSIHLVRPTIGHRLAAKIDRLVGRASRTVFGWGSAIAAAVNDIHARDPIDIFEMEESFGWCADVSRLVPIPVVVRLHGPAALIAPAEGDQSSSTKLRIESEGGALAKMHYVTSPSHSALTDTSQRYGLQPRLMRVIPNPIDMAPESDHWHVDACDSTTLLFVGRFDRLKGGDAVLAAFQQLLNENSALKLIFVGPDIGLIATNGSRIGFTGFVNARFSDIQKAHITYTGKLANSELRELRKRAIVTLVLSRWEAQGYAALEAMAQGCPLIACATGGLGELVDHGVTGFLVRPDNIGDVCRNVRALLADRHMAADVARNARRFVGAHHSVSKVAEETVAFHSEVIALANTQRQSIPH